MSWVRTLGLRLDAHLAAARREDFRTGWPSATSGEIGFYDSPMVQYRYRERTAQVSGAPTIVFTADPPVTLEVYDELLAIFSARFRVVVVELPAMGFSAVAPHYRFGFRETNDDFAHFLRAIVGPGAIWAFSCVAGLAAIDLAARQPDLANQLVLIQTADVCGFDVWKKTRDPKGILGRPILGQIMMRRLAPARMPAWYELAVGNKAKIAPFRACAANAFDKGALWSLASAFQAYMDPAVDLACISQPVLALWGRADRSHPSSNEQRADTFGDNVTRVAFDDLGHFAELEDPARVFGVVCRYLDRP